MTFTAAVAAGDEAVESLRHHLSPGVSDDSIAWESYEDQAVAWARRSPWLSSHDDGDVLVVLDGRIHEPRVQGVPPAEVLHRRYRAVGTALAEGLLGDFVLLVLDRTRSRLLVARDPLGVRPWYQSGGGPRRAGASDVATLCALPWVDDGVDEDVALGYLAAVAPRHGETLHRGITTLLPGCTWTLDSSGARHRRHHRWVFRPEPRLSWDEAAQRCREVLDQAVRCRIATAGSATSELSGGLDSSAVVGTAMLLGREDLVVGRLLFEGPAADERRYSDAVLEHWGLTAVSAPPWRPSEQESEELTRNLRRPAPDPNFTMFASLLGALRERGRCEGLTGIGGDDAFVSMPLEARVISAAQLRQRAVLLGLAGAARRDPRQAWRQTLRPTLRRLAPWVRPEPVRYVSASASGWPWLVEQVQTTTPAVTGVRAVDERVENMTSGYKAHILEESALVADHCGWRSSHPYLDPRFITATYGLDPWFAVRDGHVRALQVAAYADRLPELVLRRRSKAEFSEVVLSGGVSDEVVHRLASGPLAERGMLDRAGFSHVVVGARLGTASAALPLMRAMALDRWLRQVDA